MKNVLIIFICCLHHWCVLLLFVISFILEGTMCRCDSQGGVSDLCVAQGEWWFSSVLWWTAAFLTLTSISSWHNLNGIKVRFFLSHNKLLLLNLILLLYCSQRLVKHIIVGCCFMAFHHFCNLKATLLTQLWSKGKMSKYTKLFYWHAPLYVKY